MPDPEDVPAPEAGDVMRLLRAAELGSKLAADYLYRLVEKDLYRIVLSIKAKAGVGRGVGFTTMGLVNQAFMRLVGKGAADLQPGDRRKFFGYFAVQAHDFLIDELRKQRAKKRGEGRPPLPIDGEANDPAPDRFLDFQIDLRDALLRLEKFAPDDADLFRTRALLGCTFEDTADRMGISKTEAVRGYHHTLLWLRQELKAYNQELKEYDRDA